MHSFIAAFYFFVTVGILFFLPGWIFLCVFFRRRGSFLPLETLLFSFCLSAGLLDFLMIFLGKAHVFLGPGAIALGMSLSLLFLAALAFTWRHFRKENIAAIEERPSETGFSFSRYQHGLFITLITLTILLKTLYMVQAILPTATDLGHHMYWSKLIAVTGALPNYAREDIITDASGTYHIGAPQPIADFIIGEHLPFAAINIFSHADFFSAFPIVFLLFVNLLSLLALATLALRLASSIKLPFLSETIFTPQNIALSVLFFFGPLYTLASPQAKFVSGGVVGNTFGNLFLPLILLSYYRAFTEKRSGFLALGFFLTFTLAYIHHLSTLMLLYVLVATAIIYLLFHFNTFVTVLKSWLKLFLTPAPLFATLFSFIFFFAVAMPTYIETHAIGTAIGTPTKTTRTGLSFLQIASSNGDSRVALGLAGVVLALIAARIRKRYAGAFLIGWSVILLVMAVRPEWLFIDIPSNRIGAYLSFPLGMLAAFALMALFGSFRDSGNKLRIPVTLLFIMSFSAFGFASGDGSFDNSSTLPPSSKALATLQTFSASRYLALHNQPEDIILKDHNYIEADSWMKIFFLRGYTYPFSRGLFGRYDSQTREQCTLLMISVPNTGDGKKCYDETGTNLVVINPHFDTAQFEKSSGFSRIYTSDSVAVYRRKQ